MNSKFDFSFPIYYEIYLNYLKLGLIKYQHQV